MTNQAVIDDQLAIVLGQRQLVAVMCMFLVVLGLVATLAYVAGRSITVAQMAGTEQISTTPPPAIHVDPLKNRSAVVVTPAPPETSAPLQATAQPKPGPVRVKPTPPAPTTPEPAPIATVATPTPVLKTAIIPKPAATSLDPEPERGQIFWQVGIVERGVGPVFVEHLARQGFTARLAVSQSVAGVRVLVGPLTDRTETERVRKGLQEGGFQHFLKKY